MEGPIRTLVFTWLSGVRRTYWFWPSAMTAAAVVLGFALPLLDATLGADWTRSVGFIRATQVDGARAILTTLAGAALGVAGVAFSITIVAVSFASANFGPRLIGNFMADRTNQIILGVFVATFVYCITVLSTVHDRVELEEDVLQAFVPQISTLFAVLLTLASVGALIHYIHHIPESINVMNLSASLGEKLRKAVLAATEAASPPEDGPVGLMSWCGPPPGGEAGHAIHTAKAGYLQRVDVEALAELARSHGMRVRIDRAAGEFVGARETVMTAFGAAGVDERLAKRLRRTCKLGANRADDQDVLFLADQLVEVAVRALSPGVNDPHTAILCLDWLGAALRAFAGRPAVAPLPEDALVLYGRVSFEAMLDRTFDEMRQHISSDRTVMLHALGILAGIGAVACRADAVAACARQITRLAASANEQLDETLARAEVDAARADALDAVGYGSGPARG